MSLLSNKLKESLFQRDEECDANGALKELETDKVNLDPYMPHIAWHLPDPSKQDLREILVP